LAVFTLAGLPYAVPGFEAFQNPHKHYISSMAKMGA